MLVKELLDKKGHDVHSVSPDTLVYDALKIMAEKEIGALVVLEKGKMVGIMSERDYARKVVLRGKSSRSTLVSEVMTRDVLVIEPQQCMSDCMALMTEKHVRHLPVVEHSTVIGVVSIGDVVKEIISEQQFVIHQLENYITGAR